MSSLRKGLTGGDIYFLDGHAARVTEAEWYRLNTVPRIQ